MTQEKTKPIGGLYAKTSKKGLDYLNGYVEIEGKRINIVAFKNVKKFDERTPDYAIFVSEPMNREAAAPQRNTEEDSIPF